MKIIVGLGNPGKEYENTRHNIGFMALDLFLKKNGAGAPRDKFQSKLVEFNKNGEKIYFLKPQTYMNLSGNAIQELLQFYKIDPKTEMLVIYDDKDLNLGKIRYREQGSSGGHNGIKSIISHCGQEFCRIKCGIGSTEGNVVDFVIGDFQKGEQEIVATMLDTVVSAMEDWIENPDAEKMMRKYNKK